MTAADSAPDLPLAGIRVVELGSNVAAPYGGWVLSQLGAEVVKVERPDGGDDGRRWGPPFWGDSAVLFEVLNANKKSVTVDLGDADEREKLIDYIVGHADVVLQNLRPGVADKLGVGADDLLRRSDRLIYCNLGAFGAAGPMKDRPGYDALMQAYGGIMSATGEGGGRPPVRVGVSIVDMGTGMWCVIGILAALQRRAATGRGGKVDASLFETAVGWMAIHGGNWHAVGQVAQPTGSAISMVTPYQAYACADGHLIVAAGNDRLFRRLSDALGHPEWPDDPRFADNPARTANRPALNAALEEILASRPRAHWRTVLDAAGVPNAPIQSIDEVTADPQTEALGLVQETPGGERRLLGLPLSFDGRRPGFRAAAPPLGRDNDELNRGD